jgi:hypothetical protein
MFSQVGQIRDYVQVCREQKAPQFYRALQDLVNHLGTSLGFEVTFGRYSAVQRQIGFDGFWKSSTGVYLVVEVKTNESFPIKTAKLLNYINDLISDQLIPPSAERPGLYVVANPDTGSQQVHNAIIAEKLADKLRIISVESLLSLAELMNEFEISHADALALIRPSTPGIDGIIDLIARLIAEEKTETAAISTISPAEQLENGPGSQAHATAALEEVGTTSYWLTAVKSFPDESAEECIAGLVGQKHVYGFGENTNGRKKIKPGDMIAFYANGKGVMAHATVASLPEKKTRYDASDPTQYPWLFALKDPGLYLDKPVVIDATIRSQLAAFSGKDYVKNWAWFVQGTGRVTKHDFDLLTQRMNSAAAV